MKSNHLISVEPMTRGILVALLFTGVAACNPSPFSADGLCEAEAKAFCHFQFQCCNASERAILGPSGSDYNDEASCTEVFTRSLCADANRTMGSVDADRAAWDEAKAEKCYGPIFDAMDTCDAATVLTLGMNKAPDTCKAIVTGKVANDGVCFEDYECATEGAICRNKNASQSKPVSPNNTVDLDKQVITAEGRCVPPAAEGEDCQRTSCAPTLYCDFDPMSSTATCVLLKADGEECIDSHQCRSGSCVLLDDTMPPTCRPKFLDGNPCLISEQCQSGHCDQYTETCGIDQSTMPTFDLCTGQE